MATNLDDVKVMMIKAIVEADAATLVKQFGKSVCFCPRTCGMMVSCPMPITACEACQVHWLNKKSDK